MQCIHIDQIVEEVGARQIRANGVRAFKKAFKEKGVTGISSVVVMRLHRAREYKLIEGAHRIAALRELLKEDPGGAWKYLTVQVCKPMSEAQQLFLADGNHVVPIGSNALEFNQEKAIVVRRSILDEMQFYLRMAKLALLQNVHSVHKFHSDGAPEDPEFFALAAPELLKFVGTITGVVLPRGRCYRRYVMYFNWLSRAAWEALLNGVTRVGWDFCNEKIFRTGHAKLGGACGAAMTEEYVRRVVEWYDQNWGRIPPKLLLQIAEDIIHGAAPAKQRADLQGGAGECAAQPARGSNDGGFALLAEQHVDEREDVAVVQRQHSCTESQHLEAEEVPGPKPPSPLPPPQHPQQGVVAPAPEDADVELDPPPKPPSPLPPPQQPQQGVVAPAPDDAEVEQDPPPKPPSPPPPLQPQQQGGVPPAPEGVAAVESGTTRASKRLRCSQPPGPVHGGGPTSRAGINKRCRDTSPEEDSGKHSSTAARAGCRGPPRKAARAPRLGSAAGPASSEQGPEQYKPLRRPKQLELGEEATGEELQSLALQVSGGKEKDFFRAHFLLTAAPHYRPHILEDAHPNLEALARSEFAYANRAEEVRAAKALMEEEDRKEKACEKHPAKQRRGSNQRHEAGARQSERLMKPLTPDAGLKTDRARAIYGGLLHDGYYVWEDAFPNAAELWAEAEQSFARHKRTIFNSPSEVNKTRRSMAYLSQCPAGSVPAATALTEAWGNTFIREFGYTTDSWVWLFSEPGCRSQHPHTDYRVNYEWRRRADAGYMMPLAAVFSLEADTALHVWPGSHQPSVSERIYPKRIALPPGTGTACDRYLCVVCVCRSVQDR